VKNAKMTKHENVNTQKLTKRENKRIQNARFRCHLHARHISMTKKEDMLTMMMTTTMPPCHLTIPSVSHAASPHIFQLEPKPTPKDDPCSHHLSVDS